MKRKANYTRHVVPW